MEGPDGVSEELGALAARALACAERQQHEAPEVPHQQPEQRGHGGQQCVRGQLPGLLQLRPQHPLPVVPLRAGWLSKVGEALWGWAGRDALAYIPAFPSQTHQTGKWAVPPGTHGHSSSEEKQLANLITVAGEEKNRWLLRQGGFLAVKPPGPWGSPRQSSKSAPHSHSRSMAY